VLGTGVTILTDDAGPRDSIGRGPVSRDSEDRRTGEEGGEGGGGREGQSPGPRGRGYCPRCRVRTASEIILLV
jgi:hypothetical protein